MIHDYEMLGEALAGRRAGDGADEESNAFGGQDRSVGIVRCKAEPSIAPPPAAPANLHINARCALSGRALSSMSLWPLEPLSSLREAVRQQMGEEQGPIQLLVDGQLLVGPMTLVEAGLVDGATVDAVLCEPRFLC